MTTSLESAHPVASGPQKEKRLNITTFSSLKYRDFRYLWGTTFFTAAGNWIQQITLGWLAYHMTGNALITTAVAGVRSLPFLFVGPLAGVVADRVDRKMMLIVNHIFLAVLGLGFAMLIATGLIQVWHIFVFAVLSGIGWAANNPVRQTLVPAVVPRHALMNAIALNSAAFNLTRMVGPALGGLLIVYFGPATNFFIQSIAYLLVTVFVFPMHLAKPEAQQGTPTATAGHGAASKSAFSDLMEGLRYVAHQPTILSLVLIGLIPAIFMMPLTQSLMPVFADEALHVDARGLGLLFTAAGIGAFVGTITLATLSNVSRKGMLLLSSALAAAICLIFFSEIRWFPLAVFMLAVQGGFQMVYNSTNNAIIQIITPDNYRGRVISIYMLDHGIAFLGTLFAGAIAQMADVRVAMLAGGCITLVAILLLAVRFKELRTFRQ